MVIKKKVKQQGGIESNLEVPNFPSVPSWDLNFAPSTQTLSWATVFEDNAFPGEAWIASF